MRGKKIKVSKNNEFSIFLKIYSLYFLGFIVVCTFIFVFLFTNFGLKKELIVELGSDDLSLSSFFINEKIVNGYQLITDLKDINLNKIGSYKIKFLHNDIFKFVNIKIVDTTSPVVNSRDYFGYLDYEYDINDFIVSVDDYSEYTTEFITKPVISDFGEYNVSLKVTDASGNSTVVNVKLYITLMKMEYDLELGDALSKEDLLYDYEFYKDYIKEEDIITVNNGDVGKYNVVMKYNNKKYTCVVNKQDTIAPTFEANNVSIYEGQIVDASLFISNVVDKSEYLLKIDSDIDYSLIGDQTISVSVTDIYGNSSSKDVVLSIIYDKDAPTISGLGQITVNKNTTIDYRSGVSAFDKKDGDIDFTVDSSQVNVSSYGTYYATYSATDSSGNVVTATRKIVVNHDSTDTWNKLVSFAVNAGNDPVSILTYVRNTFAYSHDWGGDDPIWFGLTNYKGNCYVHAKIYDAMLQRLGYQTQLIWTTNKAHYWILVYMDGRWKHCDPTPTAAHAAVTCVNDQVRYANLQGRDWDRSLWPAAL